MKTFLKYLGLLIIAAGAFFARLFILGRIWNLTVVPLGVPHLTWLQMFGVTLFLQAVALEYRKESVSPEDAVSKNIVVLAGLLLGWAFAYWMFG
jgi:hypothetical protein